MSEHQTRQGITERVSVAGGELVDFVKGLVADGNVRRMVIRKPSGKTLIEIPLTAGIAVGAVIALLAPIIAAIGAMGALLAKFEVDIERMDDDRYLNQDQDLNDHKR